MWNTRVILLTDENRSAGSKTCPSVTSPTTNLTWAGLGLNAGLRSVMPATNREETKSVLRLCRQAICRAHGKGSRSKFTVWPVAVNNESDTGGRVQPKHLMPTHFDHEDEGRVSFSETLAA